MISLVSPVSVSTAERTTAAGGRSITLTPFNTHVVIVGGHCAGRFERSQDWSAHSPWPQLQWRHVAVTQSGVGCHHHALLRELSCRVRPGDSARRGVCFVTITAEGGHGGTADNGDGSVSGGAGASSRRGVAVQPGALIGVVVGGAGERRPVDGAAVSGVRSSSAANEGGVGGARWGRAGRGGISSIGGSLGSGGGGGGGAGRLHREHALVVAGGGGGARCPTSAATRTPVATASCSARTRPSATGGAVNDAGVGGDAGQNGVSIGRVTGGNDGGGAGSGEAQVTSGVAVAPEPPVARTTPEAAPATEEPGFANDRGGVGGIGSGGNGEIASDANEGGGGGGNGIGFGGGGGGGDFGTSRRWQRRLRRWWRRRLRRRRWWRRLVMRDRVRSVDVVGAERCVGDGEVVISYDLSTDGCPAHDDADDPHGAAKPRPTSPRRSSPRRLHRLIPGGAPSGGAQQFDRSITSRAARAATSRSSRAAGKYEVVDRVVGDLRRPRR
ncbi:MAG: hypothetical protein U0W40_12455 [Acidimicrobiia bacterium]